MNKYILLLCILLSFHFSIQITDEDYDKYYDYAVMIFRGMANLENKEDAKCANTLRDNKGTVLPAVKEIITLINEGATSSLDLFSPVTKLLFLNKDCNLLDLINIYFDYNGNENEIKNLLKTLGTKLAPIIDYSVD